jgi:thiamine-monophosphate kinase
MAALAVDVDAKAQLISHYRIPQPRVGLAQAVRDHASAAMDVSDGLAGDLAKLCAASGVSAAIDAASVPLSGLGTMLVDRYHGILELALSGGDDYEILCTVPEDRFEAFEQAAKLAGVAVTSIGTVIAGTGVPKFIDAGGGELALPRLSWSHF